MHSSRNILAYLEDSARRDPHACAVIDETGSYSYERLLEDSLKAGSGLVSCGAAGRSVAVLLEKSEAALACMLGALQAGACYVPVDPSVPLARLEHMAGRLDHPIVVVPEADRDSLEKALPGCRAIGVESLLESAVDRAALGAARARVLETDPAYVLFTSGSTGFPKGVAVSHGAVMSFIDEFVASFGFSKDDRFANQAPFDFDISVKDIYGSLAVGATLVLVPRRLFMQPQALVEFLDEQRATVLVWAVAALCLASSYRALAPGRLSSVRTVLFSGEVMPQAHLTAWLEGLPQARFFNLYGPTEITCNCLCHEVERGRSYERGLPLGRRLGHCEVLLVDDRGRQVETPGRVGELVVRGPSVALGYVGDAQATKRAFVQNPLHDRYEDRAYRTGDMAELLESGEFAFRGRRDNQIKYLGHRIELEEVDHAFERLPGVARCRCAFDPAKNRLRVFYEGEADESTLPRLARDKLPACMRPSSIVRVADMPLNKNGKVDRARLLEMHAGVRAEREDRPA